MKDSKLWTLHLFAGIVIIFLLGLHMLIMHLDDIFGILNPAGGKAIEWKNVYERAKMVSFVFIYIILLGAALYHGFYGLNKIIGETNINDRLRTFIGYLILIVGILLFIIGTYGAIASNLMAGKV